MKNDRCYKCKQKGHWAFACANTSRSPPAGPSDGRDIPELPCSCGAGLCLVLTSSTSKNPGRKFYRCPEWQGSDCNFFLWCDLASVDRSKPVFSNCYGGAVEASSDTVEKSLNAGPKYFCASSETEADSDSKAARTLNQRKSSSSGCESGRSNLPSMAIFGSSLVATYADCFKDAKTSEDNISEEDTSFVKEIADAAVIDNRKNEADDKFSMMANATCLNAEVTHVSLQRSKGKLPGMSETELVNSFKKMKISGVESTRGSEHILSEDMLDLESLISETTLEASRDWIVNKNQEASSSDIDEPAPSTITSIRYAQMGNSSEAVEYCTTNGQFRSHSCTESVSIRNDSYLDDTIENSTAREITKSATIKTDQATNLASQISGTIRGHFGADSSLHHASSTTFLPSLPRKDHRYMGCESIGSNSSPVFQCDSQDGESGKNCRVFDGTGLNDYLLEKMKNDICLSCKQMGHWAQDCPKKLGRKSQSYDTHGMDSDISDLPEMNCPCGIGLCLILTSGTKKNPGRKFYRCPLGRDEGNCGFFQWCDQSAMNSKKSEANLRGPMCSCGAGKTHLYTMKEGPNAGQKYFGCPIKRGQGACNFFQLSEVYTGTSGGPLGREHDHFSDLISDTEKLSETSSSHNNPGHDCCEVGAEVSNNLKDEGSCLPTDYVGDDMGADESIVLQQIEMLSLRSSYGWLQKVASSVTLQDSECSCPNLPSESSDASDSKDEIIPAGPLSPPPSLDGTQSFPYNKAGLVCRHAECSHDNAATKSDMWREADDEEICGEMCLTVAEVTDVSHSMTLSMKKKQIEDNSNCKLKGERHKMDARLDSPSNDESSPPSSPTEEGSGSGCNSDGADLPSNEASILEETAVTMHWKQQRMPFQICYKCGKVGHRKQECTW